MKKTVTIAILMFAFVSMVHAVGWTTYESNEFNIQFDIPANWNVEITNDEDVPSLMAHNKSETVVFVTMAYKDATIATEDLFDQAVDFLDMDLEGEAEEIYHNDMDAWFGYGLGNIDDIEAAIIILAATYEDNNYLVYIFTEAAAFERNANTMETIIDSFAPLY